jgi:hypothetical protein
MYVIMCYSVLLFTRSFGSVKFPALLFNMNTNRFILFLSVKEEVKVSPQAPVSLILYRAKCYTLKHLKLCPHVCTPHLEDGRNWNKATWILCLRTWIRAFSFSHRPLYPGGNSNLCPLLEGALDCEAGVETVGKGTVSGTTHRLSETSFRLSWRDFQITAKLPTSLTIICINSWVFQQSE